MSVELMDKPTVELDPKKFPFDTENKTEAEYEEIFESAEMNSYKSLEALQQYFSKFETKNANQIIFQVLCNIENIHSTRQLSLKLIEEKKVISPDKIRILEALIGEIILDTSHSLTQKFRNPYFIVKLSNLNNYKQFNFEIINRDNKQFDDWKIINNAEDIYNLHGIKEGGTGAGTMLKKDYIEDLGGYAKYIAISDEKGNKKWTSFLFEFK